MISKRKFPIENFEKKVQFSSLGSVHMENDGVEVGNREKIMYPKV